MDLANKGAFLFEIIKEIMAAVGGRHFSNKKAPRVTPTWATRGSFLKEGGLTSAIKDSGVSDPYILGYF